MKPRSAEFLQAAGSHRGAWHEFRQRFVIEGPIGANVATEMQRLQAEREQADYDAAEIPAADARAAVAAVEEFIAAVGAALGASS